MADRIGRPLAGGAARWAVAVLALLWVAGCGYHFAGGGGETFQPHIRTVYVETFTNRTSEASADSIFRSAFNSEITRRGRFKLVASQEEADAVFRGSVASLVTMPLAYKSTNLSAEERLTVSLALSLEETRSGKILWSNSGFSLWSDYAVTSVDATESSRRNALTKLANDSAERAYRAMISDF